MIVRDKLCWHKNADANLETGCWEWKFGLNHDGYGWMHFEGKSTTAHRVAYKLCIGKIPKDQVVRHVCHNRKCVNPEHLLLGTQLDNIADMVKIGRHKTDAKRKPKSEQHKQATSEAMKAYLAKQKSLGIYRATRSKLNEDQVREIRARVSRGEKCADVGVDFGLLKHAVWCIASKRTFKHVD